MPVLVVKHSGANDPHQADTCSVNTILDYEFGKVVGLPLARGTNQWQQVTLTSLLDSAFGTTQGTIIHRGASAWVVLAPGTSGQVLKSGGESANPSWAALATLLDSISSTRNTILVRGESTWSTIAVGTAGNVLRYNGPTQAVAWGRGTIVGVSAIAGMVLTDGGALGSFTPPETGPYMVTRAILDTTVKSTGAATIDVGVATNATTSSDNLFDGLDVGGSVVHADNLIDAFAGTNGKSSVYMADGSSVTVTGKADTSGLLGTLYVEYLVLS